MKRVTTLRALVPIAATSFCPERKMISVIRQSTANVPIVMATRFPRVSILGSLVGWKSLDVQ